MPKGIYQHKKYSNGRNAWNKGLPKNQQPFFGKHLSDDAKRKLSKVNKGKKFSNETKDKMKGRTPWNKGKKGLQIPWNKGIPCSEETKKKISEVNKGRKHPWVSERIGQKNWNWQGGKSFEPYSVDWTDTLKRAIKERDHYTCQLCYNQNDLTCHHIDYDKKNCDPKNLITLCRGCNAKVNFNRDYWQNLLKIKDNNK